MCEETINKRRDQATPLPSFKKLDPFSLNGSCVQLYSDANFFVKQWLQAQTDKIEREKIQRKARKADKVKLEFLCFVLFLYVCMGKVAIFRKKR